MSNKNLEMKLKTAVEHTVPDVLDAVLSACEEQKGVVFQMKEIKNKKKNWILAGASAAAAVMLLAGGVIGYGQHQKINAIDSVISLDVNPSIELHVNAAERVLSAKPLNQDATAIMSGMDLRNTDVDVAVNAIVGSMLKNGYLSELSNSILVSVENSDHHKGDALQQKLTNEINSLLSANAVDAAILSQSVEDGKDEKIHALAEKNGISTGKATLIQHIMEQNKLLTVDKLAPLSINELNLLLNAKDIQLPSVSTSGTPSEKSYIGEAAAKAKALAHAQVTQEQTSKWHVALDTENGIMVYDVEFYVDAMEYDYEINALTGDIVSAEKDVEDTDNEDKEDNDDKDDNEETTTTTTTIGSGTSSSGPSGTQPSKPVKDIGIAKAKSIVLQHAGLSNDQVRFTKAEREEPETVHDEADYELEFYVGNTKYDYEIHAETGEVLDHQKEETTLEE